MSANLSNRWIEQEPWLARRPANFNPLTPVDLLVRTIEAHPDRPAVEWKGRRWTYREFGAIVGRLARLLHREGIAPGDVVAVMSFNRPELLAAHFAVPMIGGILNAINTRLDADTVAYILEHSQARLVLCDGLCEDAAERAAAATGVPLRLLDRSDRPLADCFDVFEANAPALPINAEHIRDEWQPICVNYTSGTTGHPKGVVYHHRGAYLNAIGNVLALGLNEKSVYLWTLPMFHCNGWCHTWAVTAAAGLHVCLERPDPAAIFGAIAAHPVTHFSCAPAVLYMLVNHPDPTRPSRPIRVATGGAAPTSTLIAQLGELGFTLTHLYGLTESFGPVTLCTAEDEEVSLSQKARLLARQGVRHLMADHVRILEAGGTDVARDGATLGEIVLRGNTLMAGYLHDEAATEAAFKGGLFHTGDLAVLHPEGHVEIKDRSKDIIISGGENISSLEIESVLHQHPAILMAAVVAAPDLKWGETPCAFIELKAGAAVDPRELQMFCRERLAGFKVPRRFVFGALPKTATGKVQKFALRQRVRDAEHPLGATP